MALKSVFIGNIPYDTNEQQLLDVFAEVGPVVTFRLVRDQEGKLKGFGFCEYRDADTANSAVRNLNKYEINGRELRVKLSTSALAEEKRREAEKQLHAAGGRTDAPGSSSRNSGSNSAAGSSLGQGGSPMGSHSTAHYVIPGMTHQAEQVQRIVDMTNREVLSDVVWQMRSLIIANPDQSKAILHANPQLAFALLQAMIALNVVDPDAVQRIVAPTQLAAQHIAPPAINPPPRPVASLPISTPDQPMRHYEPPAPQYPQTAVSRAPERDPRRDPRAGPPPPVPVAATTYAAPVISAQHQPILSNPTPMLPPEIQQQLDRVLAISPQDFERMNPTEKAQIEALRRLAQSMGR